MKKVKGIVFLIVEDQNDAYQCQCEACEACDTGGSTCEANDQCEYEG